MPVHAEQGYIVMLTLEAYILRTVATAGTLAVVVLMLTFAADILKTVAAVAVSYTHLTLPTICSV